MMHPNVFEVGEPSCQHQLRLYSGYAKGETEEILLNALGITTGEVCKL